MSERDKLAIILEALEACDSANGTGGDLRRCSACGQTWDASRVDHGPRHREWCRVPQAIERCRALLVARPEPVARGKETQAMTTPTPRVSDERLASMFGKTYKVQHMTSHGPKDLYTFNTGDAVHLMLDLREARAELAALRAENEALRAAVQEIAPHVPMHCEETHRTIAALLAAARGATGEAR